MHMQQHHNLVVSQFVCAVFAHVFVHDALHVKSGMLAAPLAHAAAPQAGGESVCFCSVLVVHCLCLLLCLCMMLCI
jgi:hypothetical protein